MERAPGAPSWGALDGHWRSCCCCGHWDPQPFLDPVAMVGGEAFPAEGTAGAQGRMGSGWTLGKLGEGIRWGRDGQPAEFRFLEEPGEGPLTRAVALQS